MAKLRKSGPIVNASRKDCPECGAIPNQYHKAECQRESKYVLPSGFDVTLRATCEIKVRVGAFNQEEAIKQVQAMLPIYDAEEWHWESTREFQQHVGIPVFEDYPNVSFELCYLNHRDIKNMTAERVLLEDDCLISPEIELPDIVQVHVHEHLADEHMADEHMAQNQQ